ncbi:hypothetical protein ACFQS1_26865 [Paractinoplanes rhizophilus]|jgi:hypothetical protein|uniref:Uncharacterized protein n=1 Tax=Paractinoplanes rhizophilus TaxID=1416877 RepID=A0ABW2HWZ8_9ACTN|nr:hypothetical protein [Actinoplanes sp.]
MTDTLRQLRWYAVLAVLFFGILPMTMVSLLVAQGRTPQSVGLLLIGGIPLVVAAVVYAVIGLAHDDPEVASHRLRRSMALVAIADVLVLGGNALIRMASN